MGGELAETIATVRERVRPSRDEREQLELRVTELIERTEAAIAERSLDAEVLRVGSTARDTWLRGERDIDIFVRFPPDLDRDDLERYGVEIGQAVLPDGRLEYAEHPYVTGEFEEYSVDLVPCYGVESGAEIRSAVDRTPFHAEYVAARLDDDLANEVRVLKRFCEAVGVYGSDLRTRGFSGYLTELLVLEFGTFRGVVEAAATWHPPVRIDPADHGDAAFADPLVVIDPTDPRRNVAAVLTRRNVARFQHHARALLANPDPSRFEPDPPGSISPEELRAELARRRAHAIALRFSAPDVVEDQLYPQLRRTRDGLVAALEERGFAPIRAAAFADEDAVIYLELAVDELPAIERHEGPPVHVRSHADAFLEKWSRDEAYGPFIDGDRYVVERERDVRSPVAFLESDRILETGVGADIRPMLAGGYEILVAEEVTALLPAFAADIAAFYDPSP